MRSKVKFESKLTTLRWNLKAATSMVLLQTSPPTHSDTKYDATSHHHSQTTRDWSPYLLMISIATYPLHFEWSFATISDPRGRVWRLERSAEYHGLLTKIAG